MLLSGGIDSSAILAFSSRFKENVKSFSIGFEEPSFDESLAAMRAAKYFNSDLSLKMLSLSKAKDIIHDAVRLLDEPMADASIIPTWLLCADARKKVTVALSGDGGDELFAGYDPFKALSAANFYNKLVPKPVHKAIRLVAARLPASYENISLDFAIKKTLSGLSYEPRYWCPVWMGPLEPFEIAEVLNSPVDIEELYEDAVLAWESVSSGSPVDRVLQFYTRLYLADDILVKSDRASMMHSLELRAPFLDIDLVDFIRKIPWNYKFSGNTTKYILKRAMKGILPDDIIYRKKKGFGLPVARWILEGAFDKMPKNLLNEEFLKKAVSLHSGGKRDHRLFLYAAWLLENAGAGTEAVLNN